jgi:hypothetical protein
MSRPVEPPVGTVLETSDNIETYQIEHTPEGWAVQYQGENGGFWQRLNGRYSWESAWRGWGPPAGAEPFREVAPDDLSVPPYEEEDASADASDATFDPPPAAQPYRPGGGTASTGTTNGGGGMSAVSEAKGLLATASEQIEQAQAMNQEVISRLEEAQQSVLAAIDESSQAASDEAQGLIQRAIEVANEQAQNIAAIPQTLESIQL